MDQNLIDTLCGPPSPTSEWDTRAYEEFRESLPADRHDEDRLALARAFNTAADNPAFAQAVEWAAEHDLRFFIDRSLKPTARFAIYGYHTPGTGVVALTEAAGENAPRILTHEIRHAKDDYDGLLESVIQPFPPYLISSLLIEAVARGFEGAAADPSRTPWDCFTAWYDQRAHMAGYGEAAACLYAARRGVEDAARPGAATHAFEFRPRGVENFSLPGMALEKRIALLNRDFTNRPWFNAAAAPAFFEKILSEAQALRFYDETRADPSPVVRKICAAQGIAP